MDSTLAPAPSSPAAVSLEELNHITAGQSDSQGCMDPSIFSLDTTHFGFPDFGTPSIDQGTDSSTEATSDVPQEAGESAVGQPEALPPVEGDFTDFFQRDLEQFTELPPPAEDVSSSSDYTFDFDFPMSEISPIPEPYQQPGYIYPPPPMGEMDNVTPYYTAQPQYAYPSANPAYNPFYQPHHQFSNITPPLGSQLSSLNNPFYPAIPTNNMGPPPPVSLRPYKPISNLQQYEGAFTASTFAFDGPTSAPSNPRKRRLHGPSPLGSGDQRKMTAKQKKAPIKNYLAMHGRSDSGDSATTATSSDSSGAYGADTTEFDPFSGECDAGAFNYNDYPPNTFTLHTNSAVSREAKRQRMDSLRAQREMMASCAGITTSAAYQPNESEYEELRERYAGMASPPKIQGRRKKHPGRKITVPQTPEVIKRNAMRRERYRNGLLKDKARLEEYERNKPQLISVMEVEYGGEGEE